MFDPMKVKWAKGEIDLLKKVVDIIDIIKAEQDDKDPGEIDTDDFFNIVRKSIGHFVYIVRHFMALGSTMAMLDEATDLLSMVKRYYGLPSTVDRWLHPASPSWSHRSTVDGKTVLRITR